MSIVGPRPERVEHVQKYSEEIPEWHFREKVKGGLTGYAQIFGKYNTSAYDKLRFDLYYIENYSLRLDIKLMFMTLRILFSRLMDNAAFYRKAFTVTGQNGFEESFTARMRDLLLRARDIRPVQGQTELLTGRIIASFHAVCFVSAVKSWLETGKNVTVEELTEAYLYLVNHSVWNTTM